jgi:HEAT repeat protein
MAENKPDVKALVAQMPEVDKPGAASKFTGPTWGDADKIFTEIFAGGRASLLELLVLVHDPSDTDFENYKAEYVLHGMVLFAGRAGKEKERLLLAETLAGRLDDPKFTKGTRGLFIRELQWVGGKEVVDALARQIKDQELGQYAIAALVAIGQPGIAALRKGLSVPGRNRLAAIQALGRLEDAGAAADLRRVLAAPDKDARIAAAWALANMGDATSINAMLKAADAGDDWEKPQNTKACFLLAEKLTAAGKRADAKKIYQHLKDTRNGEKEKYVRDAADKALVALNVLL